MAKPKIIFRADGNQAIGMGHFFRTLALAEMLKDDFYCIYAIRSPSDYQIREINKICNERIDLPSNETHFEVFINILKGNEIVVLDNYYFTTQFQQHIKKKGCLLVCIDDLNNQHFVADIVINQSPGAKAQFYSTEKHTILLLGFDYALLRSAFLSNSWNERRKKYSVLVIMGGTDPLKITPMIINKISSIEWELPIAVVYNGEGFENTNKVVKFKNLTADNLAKLMYQSHIGIFPASTISIEACACRLPFITGYFIENQKQFYFSLVNSGLAIGIDKYDDKLQTLEGTVVNLYNNKVLQNKIVNKQIGALDKMVRNRILKLFHKLDYER